MHFMLIALIPSLILSSTTAEKAQCLVHYDKTDGKFEINHNVLSQLLHLPKHVKVISTIGEARLGKSTTLNFVRHILDCDGKHEAEIEEVFETGDSCRAATHGIWMSVCEKQNIVLLDVQGMGNDVVTEFMNVFIFRLSSATVVFSYQTVTNDIVNLLYKVTRLSEHISDKDEIGSINKFSHLHIVILNSLTASPGKIFEDEVRDMVVTPSGEDEATDNKRRAIAKYFQSITVGEMPLTGNRQLWGAILSLFQSFKNFPAKTTFEGVLAGGKALVQIAETSIMTMNKDSWSDFGDLYAMVEKYLCDKIFQITVAPILELKTADEIEQKKESVLKAFKDACALTEEVNKTEDLLTKTISEKKEKIMAEERLKEANDKRVNAKLNVTMKVKAFIKDVVTGGHEIWNKFMNVTNDFLSQPGVIERCFTDYTILTGIITGFLMGFAFRDDPWRFLTWLIWVLFILDRA